MSDSTEKIYSSPPSEPDDELWLEEGKRMVTESLSTVRNAAGALIAALGILQGVYLAVLGLGEKQLRSLSLLQQALFISPMLLWLASFYLCLAVVMTRKFAIFTNSPSDIRDKSIRLLLKKQLQLQWAFWLLAVGLLATWGLFFSRLQS
ncbi:MAG: hypothetical protein ONB46_23945 [candidate division KSB1 bacterium]|nr:hypothetical protein [candidate division KSB1 bacterium]MDZ7368919.1 hypothetical protein [candidate division KSB1 bacterium]MDZ7406907.1 hypothetical protein [candidate division KSB1 bacterium]